MQKLHMCRISKRGFESGIRQNLPEVRASGNFAACPVEKLRNLRTLIAAICGHYSARAAFAGKFAGPRRALQAWCSISRDASASVRACGWPGCRKDSHATTSALGQKATFRGSLQHVRFAFE